MPRLSQNPSTAHAKLGILDRTGLCRCVSFQPTSVHSPSLSKRLRGALEGPSIRDSFYCHGNRNEATRNADQQLDEARRGSRCTRRGTGKISGRCIRRESQSCRCPGFRTAILPEWQLDGLLRSLGAPGPAKQAIDELKNQPLLGTQSEQRCVEARYGTDDQLQTKMATE